MYSERSSPCLIPKSTFYIVISQTLIAKIAIYKGNLQIIIRF